MIGISANSIASFCSCRRKYYYEKVLHRVPATTSTSLSIGSAVHKGLESYWNNINDISNEPELLHQVIQDATDACHGLCVEDICKVHAMLEGYMRYFDEDRTRFTTVDVESSFSEFLIDDATVHGFMDAVVIEKGTGKYWLVEHKTARAVDDYYRQHINIDVQCGIYLYVLREKYGNDVGGVIYDIIRKPGIKMQIGESDEEFEARKAQLKAPGRCKQKKAETCAEFMDRLCDDLSNAYERIFITMDNIDLNNIISDVKCHAEEIIMAHETGSFFRSTCNCSGKFGVCPYFDVCCGRYSIESDIYIDSQSPFQSKESNSGWPRL